MEKTVASFNFQFSTVADLNWTIAWEILIARISNDPQFLKAFANFLTQTLSN